MPPLVVLTLLFVVGQLAYVLKRMAFAIRNPANPVNSRREYLIKNWDAILFRMFVAQVIFWTWVTYPDGLSRLLGLFHITADLTIPTKPVVALGAGLVSDVALDWLAQKIPMLSKELPQTNGVSKPPAANAQSAGGDTK